MTWVKIDDKIGTHPKVTAAGDLYLESLGLWVAGVAHANGHHTDGRIGKHELRSLAPTDAVPLERLVAIAANLVATCRWHDEGSHWRIHGYENEQEEALKSNVEQKREYERLRKRAQREAAKQRKLAELQALGATDPPVPLSRRDTFGTPRGTAPGQSVGQHAGHGTDEIGDRSAPITPLRVPLLSHPPGPARPGPARSIAAGAATLLTELQQQQQIVGLFSDLPALAAALARAAPPAATPTAITQAVVAACADLDEAATAATAKRHLRRYVERAREPDETDTAAPYHAITATTPMDRLSGQEAASHALKAARKAAAAP